MGSFLPLSVGDLIDSYRGRRSSDRRLAAQSGDIGCGSAPLSSRGDSLSTQQITLGNKGRLQLYYLWCCITHLVTVHDVYLQRRHLLGHR